jgi:drug/metabolite transporter (DMT)-like permease
MIRKVSDVLIASLCLAFVVLIWGMNWLVIKDALRLAPPLFFTGVRLLGGAMAIALVRWSLGYTLAVAREGQMRLLMVGLLQMACGLGLSLVGLQYLDVGRSALIFYTMPLWLAVIEWILDGRRQTGVEFAALSCGLSGIALLASSNLSSPTLVPTLSGVMGVILLSVAAFCWALGTWVSNRVSTGSDVWSRTVFQLATSGGAVMCASLLLEPHFDISRLSGLAAPIAFNCIAATGLAFVAWYRALTSISARIASQSLILIPVVALISAAILQGEQLARTTVLACALISAGVTMTIWQPRGYSSRART